MLLDVSPKQAGARYAVVRRLLVVGLLLTAGCADSQAAQKGCDTGYSGACVPQYPPDVDCGDVGSRVSVGGSDPHGLDRDGDGVGCEVN